MAALEKQVGGNHYKNLVIQPIEYCQKNRLNYCESNVVKYVTRHKFKNGAEDIKKAIHNLELLLEMDYPDHANYGAKKNNPDNKGNGVVDGPAKLAGLQP